MSNSNSNTGTLPQLDPTKRQVLPASSAVRFRRRDWERSSQVREVLDSFVTTPARAERYVDPAESIIMSGNEILNTLRTGSHVVKQKRTVDFEALPELAIAEPFVPVVTTVRDEAAVALAAINDRKPHARRSHRLTRKPATTPKATSTVLTWTLLVASALVAGCWLYLSVAPFAR